MNGKKFTFIFAGLILITAVVVSVLMKQGYDSRPAVNIIEEKK